MKSLLGKLHDVHFGGKSTSFATRVAPDYPSTYLYLAASFSVTTGIPRQIFERLRRRSSAPSREAALAVSPLAGWWQEQVENSCRFWLSIFTPSNAISSPIRALQAFPGPDHMESSGTFPEAFDSRHSGLAHICLCHVPRHQISNNLSTLCLPD